MNAEAVPVITVDGPSGSGKGTICRMLAKRMGYHYLDSGALYRLLALVAKRHGIALDNEEDLEVLAGHMDIAFIAIDDGLGVKVMLEGEDVTRVIRTEAAGNDASKVAQYSGVRTALLSRQQAFAALPGLVADGRDMGTVVFPGAETKIFLTASPQERAKRRHKQLIDKGEDVSLAALVDQVKKRDQRDTDRDVSPLVPAEQAISIDSSELSIEAVLEAVLNIVKQSQSAV